MSVTLCGINSESGLFLIFVFCEVMILRIENRNLLLLRKNQQKRQ